MPAAPTDTTPSTDTDSSASPTAAVAAADDTGGVPRSVARVLDLFEIVLAKRSCNLTTAAATSGLTPTTALRYLRALEARGYLVRDSAGDFSAGPTILRIAASLRGSTSLERLITLAQPLLDTLARDTGESAYLAVSDGHVGTYVATAESSRAIRHVGWIGQDVDLGDSALGAALAAPGTTAFRTGAVEADIAAMSRAVTVDGALGIAVSVVGPDYRFTDDQRVRNDEALTAAVDTLTAVLHTNGEHTAS